MRAAKVDSNQPAIVKALRDCGCLVEPLHMVGKGVPDLLCCFRGNLFLVEVKDGSLSKSRQQLTPSEQAWHVKWSDAPVYIVASVDELGHLLGVVGG